MTTHPTSPRKHLAALALLLAAGHASGFGIDKLAEELDASQGFRSVAKFGVFNDDIDTPVYVTARALSWDFDAAGALVTSPSDQLQISPSVQKIAGGGTGVYRVRYAGPPLHGEGNFRVLFTQIRIPSGTPVQEGAWSVTSEPEPGFAVGLAMTVPVYVADFSTKVDALAAATARVVRADGQTRIDVTNGSERHITVDACRIDARPTPLQGVVLAHRTRSFSVPGPLDATTRVELDITARGRTRTVAATLE